VGSTVRSRLSRLDRPVLAQLLSFAGIGALTTCVDLFLFNLLRDQSSAMPANVCGYVSGTILAWLLNNRYTFGSASQRLDFSAFVAVNMAGLALTTAMVQVAAILAPNDVFLVNLTKLGAGAGIMFLKFVALRTWIAGMW
jgi:putative flippase GtrA